MTSVVSVDSIIPIRILISAKLSILREIQQTLLQVLKSLKSKSYLILYFLDESILKRLKKKAPEIQCILANTNDPPVEYVVTFGGDGTILYAAKIFKKHNPVFLTFKMGTLGFLCRFTLNQISNVLYKAISIRTLSDEDQFPFRVHRFLRIQGTIKNGNKISEPEVCLNEIAITRNHAGRIILKIFVNNQLLTETGGDGVLIATPTGSTAYSLSAGGPVVQNGINCMIIVPISPHSLSFRPLCLQLSSVIRIQLSQRSAGSGYISFDGQTNKVFNEGDQVVIKRSQKFLRFYEPNEDECQLPNWSNRLKMFLNWNQPFKSNQQQNPNEASETNIPKPKL